MHLSYSSQLVWGAHFLNSSVSPGYLLTDSATNSRIQRLQKLVVGTDCNLLFQGLKFMTTLVLMFFAQQHRGIFKIEIVFFLGFPCPPIKYTEHHMESSTSSAPACNFSYSWEHGEHCMRWYIYCIWNRVRQSKPSWWQSLQPTSSCSSGSCCSGLLPVPPTLYRSVIVNTTPAPSS